MAMRRWWWVLGVVLLVALMPGMAGAAARDALAPVSRGYVGGRFALELDGVIVGFVQDVEGGHPVADVVTEKLGGDWLVRKHIGNVKYEEIALKADASLARPFYDWIRASLDGKHERKSGSIIYLDREGNEVERLSFAGGLLSEIGMPALDAGLMSAAQAVEHYEIARYGTLCAWAKQLGYKDAIPLLEATLREETETDVTLTKLAEGALNAAAQKKVA